MGSKRKFTEGLLDDTRILDELNLAGGQTVLDAGCGSGYMARKFSSRVGKDGSIVALDIDKPAIDVLQRQVEGSNITAIVGDITKTTHLPSGMFDLVYLSTVYHIFSLNQVQGLIKEVTRLLKEKALFAVVNIKKVPTSFGPPMEMRSSPEELRRKINLKAVKCIEVGSFFYMQVFEKN